MEDPISRIERDVKEIMNNDLPHIKSKLIALEINQKWVIGILLLVLGTVIAGAFTNFFN